MGRRLGAIRRHASCTLRPRSIAALAGAALAIGAACGGRDSGDDEEIDPGPPFTVSGTMLAAAGSAIDSDTNDSSAPFLPNGSAAQAQEIANPVTLGGHTNVAGAGPPGAPVGRTTVSGDTEDWFRVSLAAGQTVRLQIAEDGATNDLDLELRALDESLVDSGATASRTEEVLVSASGDYYIVVVASAGFSNYTLTIGQMPTDAGAGPTRDPEFVPGQIVVRYRDDLGSAAGAASASERANRVGMRHVSGAPDGPMLFAAETLDERRAAFRALGLRRLAVAGDERSLRADTQRLVLALRRRPDVQSADLNYLRHPTAVPADVFYPYQWHYDQINLPPAWDIADPDSGVIVALVDTGVKQGHPDLSGQLVAGYDFVTSVDSANDGNGCDADPDDPGDDAPGGSSYHGTHVAGTLAARTSFSSGNTEGVAGVAWNARIMPLRVLGVGGGTDADIMAALRYAAGRANACGAGAAAPARIANMSLGGPGFSQTFQDLLTDLRTNAGMIFVAAAGNGASSQPFYPAAFDGVISVSAVGSTRTLAPYSNFGGTIDIAAPGGDFSRDVDGDGFPDGVLSTFFQDGGGFGYAFYQGTSMATPHVAGVLALMLGINPSLTPFDIDNALNAGEITEDIGSSQFFGNGLIDAVKAVNKAATGGGGATVLDAVLRIDPDGLSYGFLANEFRVSASNGGNDQQLLTVTGITFTSDDGAPWLTVTPEAVDAEGLGTYRATVDRSGLADGLYTGTLSFGSDRNDVDVAVIMSVGDATSAQASAGHHYVLLVDPGTFDTIDAHEADAANGRYAFKFDAVDPGDYLIIAGTDSDNDDFICDPGEACGAYPTTETIVPITVESHRTGLFFTTGFGLDVGTTAAGVTPSARGYSREVGGSPAE